MALNLGSFGNTLTQYLPSISSYLTNQQPTNSGMTTTATGLPRLAEQAGGMALLGYAMRPQEDITVPSIYDSRSPYGTSSVNYLQGLYQAPQDPFAAGGAYSQYLPQMQAAETELFDDIQQRLIAGQPGGLSTAMGGPEIAAIREGFLTRALPQRLALQADLMREMQARQQSAANTVYGGENQLNQIGFAAEIEAAIANARSESERNAILGSLGTALLLSGGRGGTAGMAGLPGGMPGQPSQGGLGQAIQQALGGSAGMGQYAPIGQMSAADIIGQMQAGTLSQSEGLALLASTSLPGLIGAGGAGYGVGSALGGAAGGATDSQYLGATAGALSGAATGAAIGSIVPGVGTAIGAIVGGIAGLFGGFGSTESGQQDLKEAFRQADLDSQADQVQEIGSFFNQRLSALGVDTSGYQQIISQMIAASSGPGNEQAEVGRIGGELLLRALQQQNPSITSLSAVPGLREEFIDWMLRTTTVGDGRAVNPEEAGTYWSQSGLATGGNLPAGGEFVVGERGPELLRAAPGSQVLPMRREMDGAFAFDPTATARNVMPQNIFLPQTSMPFERPPMAFNSGSPFALPPGQALIAALNPQMMAPGSVPTMLGALRASGAFPGQGAMVPPVQARSPVLGTPRPQMPLLQRGQPSFAGTRPSGSRGQSTLATALQQTRTRRKKNAPAYP